MKYYRNSESISRNICFFFKSPKIYFQSSNVLLQKDVLLDDMLSSKQAQKLLRLICMQNGNLPEISDDSTSNKPRNILTKILENVDEWNLRISTVDINLMYIYTRRNGKFDYSLVL